MTRQSNAKNIKHRGHHQGSIQKTKYGKWRAWVTLPDGKRIGKTFTLRRDAIDWIYEHQDFAGKLEEEDQTFGEYIEQWFKYHTTQVKESTRCDYEIIIRKYILPHMGNEMLNDLHRSVFDAYYTHLRSIPVGDTQIRYIHRVIHKALQDAVDDRILPYNPSDGAKAPKKPKAKRINCPLNEEQCDLLISAAMQKPVGPLIYLAIKTGMRQGELFALKWKDINWQTQQVHIQRNVQRILHNGKQERIFSTPKRLQAIG